MSLVIFRLHPMEPVEGSEFTDYLDDLTVRAWDLTTQNSLDGALLGEASYLAPPDPTDPQTPDPDTRIVQHFEISGVPPVLELQSVATAVIEVPAGEPEHETVDLRLEITRGSGEIVHRRVYVNVPVHDGALPGSPGAYPSLEPTSLLLPLPDPGRDVTDDDAYVELPGDGTPPRYEQLRDAIELVLGGDPGDDSVPLADLTARQARHVAYEITWNAKFRPRPTPPLPLEEMYTGPRSDEEDQGRRRFEGDLVSYYATGDAEAERLTAYVYAVGAAVWAEQQSTATERVGFRFPVVPGQTETGERYTDARVILTGLDVLDPPAFGVPAEYWYVLGATLSPQVTREQRYDLAVLEDQRRAREAFQFAVDDRVITEDQLEIAQAVRRLRALGDIGANGTEYEVTGDPVRSVIDDWLAYTGEDIADFWDALAGQDIAGHLELVLHALTRGHLPLIAVLAGSPNVDAAADLHGWSAAEWRAVFGHPIDDTLLPAFTEPGSGEERLATFIRHVKKFFSIRTEATDPGTPAPGGPPRFRWLTHDPITRFVAEYEAATGAEFEFGGTWDASAMRAAVAAVFGGDTEEDSAARTWLEQAVGIIDELTRLAATVPPELRFSVMEALYARGFTDRSQVGSLTLETFTTALTGTVAHDHASAIHALGTGAPTPGAGRTGFRPINDDGCLVDCVPPAHRSPLGLVAYLHQMLRQSTGSTCHESDGTDNLLAHQVGTRRGPITDLDVTAANLSTRLPVIDLVNESLEALAANLPNPASGVIHQTARDELAGHQLADADPHNPGPDDPTAHDPTTLFAAVPEHSTPATPVAEPGAYQGLRSDFSAPELPYHQPLDVNRTYLCHLGTTRYATMRRFRRDITELVLGPDAEPAGFQRHLWRYPVRLDIAMEYLCISPEEHELFSPGRDDSDGRDDSRVPSTAELYGYHAHAGSDSGPGDHWVVDVLRLPVFLERTGLSYCEFLDLWRSGFVPFDRERESVPPIDVRRGQPGDDPGPPDHGGREEHREPPGGSGERNAFPDCEPCDLDAYRIRFRGSPDEQGNPMMPLHRLVVFIRLWRKLREPCPCPCDKGESSCCCRGYSFAQLRDICEVLELFDADGAPNPDFLRQLAAFSMLRDDFDLALVDPSEADESGGDPAATGADRTHLLALWVGPTAAKWGWAVAHLLDQVQQGAQRHLGCECRPPDFMKLLAANLDPLSLLAGFDPESNDDTWHAHPTHTLRFAEILEKIYASGFGIGELLFFCTADRHLGGDDPFPLQPPNEAADSPLGLPDDETEFSLWDLRARLLQVEVSEEDTAAWDWNRIEATLREDFGLEPPTGEPDPLLALGRHFFPSALEAAGHTVPAAARWYRVDLAGTAPPMWNTPSGGPFRYDTGAEQLWTSLPLTDEAVLAKLSRVRQLSEDEQRAVRELYFQPRADLAPFAFLFADFGEAQRRLIEEPDEAERFRYFQREVARCHSRCRAIAEHLTAHVAKVTGKVGDSPRTAGYQLAWRLLRHLYADENRATTSWENDTGHVPDVTWPDRPSGGAFAALLGLSGTGLLGEIDDQFGTLVWRELRGPMDPFGAARNTFNSPVPTVVPTMGLEFTAEQERFAAVRNGFALANPDGAALGGAEGYTVRWRGALLVENAGGYEFRADASADRRWRVMLERGQRTWVLLSHDWPEPDDAPADCSAPIDLRRGTYRLTVEFAFPSPELASAEDVCPATGGFRLAYAGPDTGEEIVTVPHDKLFAERKDRHLADRVVGLEGASRRFLAAHYTSSLRDIRRTYQRAFKALLFAHRFELSALPESDSGQSEIGYLLEHAENFVGTSYHRIGGGFGVHRAFLDPNFLPVRDNYLTPAPGQDRRVRPSDRRKRALFDWWERIFDYTVVRTEARPAPEHPTWLLFHEAAENHPDDPAHLLRHLGVDLLHTRLVLRYFDSFEVGSADLEDERWAIRAWRADTWVRAVRKAFFTADIRHARPAAWAADEPGNASLTRFVREGCLENPASGSPPGPEGLPTRRYADIQRLNDCLRERGRTALLAYLCRMDRVPLPWGGFAETPEELSELLLIDVQAGLCQRTSRIEEAISAVRLFVQRARLRLEPSFEVTDAFALMWDRRFATHRIWERCARRTVYRENWIEWDELEQARRSEAFGFLESELRRSTLSVAIPGGLEHWPGRRPPTHPALAALQSREPSHIQALEPPREGLDLLGDPVRAARPSWLTTVGPPRSVPGREEEEGEGEGGEGGRAPVPVPDSQPAPVHARRGSGEVATREVLAGLPLWLRAAIGLGTRFVRVAAAAEPSAGSQLEPRHPDRPTGCCVDCDAPHDAQVDEYYFWLVDGRRFETPPGGEPQDAEWRWHEPDARPGLLHWDSEPVVYLAWGRVTGDGHPGHAGSGERAELGERGQVRRSTEPVAVTDPTADLILAGRTADSLRFEVAGGLAPVGHIDPTPPGFRYDMATDTAVPLPLVAAPVDPMPDYPGGLPAYPYFAYLTPGAPVVPSSPFAAAITVAAALRAHCRFEAALRWYETAFDALRSDASWCRPGPSAADHRNRAIVLHYVETLFEWGDALMRRNDSEAFAQARLIYETAVRLLGEAPRAVAAVETVNEPYTVGTFVPMDAPLNPRLGMLYRRSTDRLGLIRSCSTAYRLRYTTHVETGCVPVPNVSGPCAEDADWCAPISPYRFEFLIAKARELAEEVRGFGAALLAAYEKGDAEHLASLRAGHERQLLELALDVRQHQWRESDWQVQALQKTKEIAQTRRRYYATLIANGLNSGESAYEALTGVALGQKAASVALDAVAQVIGLIPDPFPGFPTSQMWVPGGTKIGAVFAAAARISGGLADISTTTAGLRLTQGGWDRREEEWRHQVEVLDIEIEQIERQILAATNRRDIAARELNIQQWQIEQAGEVHDFLRDKFTSHDLYLFLQAETAGLHHQAYELALHTARQAQRAHHYESGFSGRRFVPDEGWTDLRESLLAGDRMQGALRQLEHAHLDGNRREYELTKHLSLRLHFPVEYLRLLATGVCEIAVPEWMFDLDYPGHYLRRIKSLRLTIPCVTGPYTGVHCRVTLLASSTRVSPDRGGPVAGCCPDDRCAPEDNGYQVGPDDPRVVCQYAATEAIATSSGQDDAGMFELNFRDERYLPFEFAGAVSRWRIELPPENNQFDIASVADVVLHLGYTAREGGVELRRAANQVTQSRLPREGLRYFDVARDMPDAWHLFTGDTRRRLALRLSRGMFPFLSGAERVSIDRIELFVEDGEAVPNGHHRITFHPAASPHGAADCPPREVHGVARSDWPGLFHGVLDDVELGPIDEPVEVAALEFPATMTEVNRVHLLCHYTLCE